MGKKKKKVVTELGQLVDMPIANFKKYVHKANLGYLRSLHNMFVITYNNVSLARKDFVDKCTREKLSVENAEVKNTLVGLFSKLMKTEEKVFVLRELIESLESKELGIKKDVK